MERKCTVAYIYVIVNMEVHGAGVGAEVDGERQVVGSDGSPMADGRWL
jgi:hypothetical protein